MGAVVDVGVVAGSGVFVGAAVGSGVLVGGGVAEGEGSNVAVALGLMAVALGVAAVGWAVARSFWDVGVVAAACTFRSAELQAGRSALNATNPTYSHFVCRLTVTTPPKHCAHLPFVRVASC